jgi:hypothetical protein
MTVQCCMCKKVKHQNDWVLRTLQAARDVSHTYCPQCLELSKVTLLVELSSARKAKAVLA